MLALLVLSSAFAHGDAHGDAHGYGTSAATGDADYSAPARHGIIGEHSCASVALPENRCPVDPGDGEHGLSEESDTSEESDSSDSAVHPCAAAATPPLMIGKAGLVARIGVVVGAYRVVGARAPPGRC